MPSTHEFRYRTPQRVPGLRPGTHAGTGLGAGLEFITHLNLYARPDPRRLDLRASLASLHSDWLVRVNRERAAMTVRLLVDVSASMRFGSPPKLEVVCEFVRALCRSAFRVGDAVGMVAFDRGERADLHVGAWRHRGMGEVLSAMLSRSAGSAGGLEGLQEAALLLAGRGGMVFLLSDFHWPLQGLGDVLDMLSSAHVVPIVVWDAAETAPPGRDGIAMASDAESGRCRTLWMRPGLRSRWREVVAQRRAELDRLFGAHGLRPFYMEGGFDGEALSEHLCEGGR